MRVMKFAGAHLRKLRSRLGNVFVDENTQVLKPNPEFDIKHSPASKSVPETMPWGVSAYKGEDLKNFKRGPI